MPIIPPPTATPPYDSVNSVLNGARVRINDAIASLGGDILTNVQPFTQEMTNLAWRKMQEYLANLGYTRCKQEVILPGIPPVTSFDPGSQVFLNWTSYFNGTGTDIPPATPVLPQDMILPLRMWERQANGNGNFIPMSQALDGLPSCVKLPCNGYWEWRQDAIYMPGATNVVDLRMRYAGYLSDFLTVGDVNWYDLPVPIMRCKDSFSYYIAAEAAAPRADLDAQTFSTKAEQAANLIFNREVQQKQRTTATRRPYGHRFGGYI